MRRRGFSASSTRRCMRAAGSARRMRARSNARPGSIDPVERATAVRTLVAEETRLGMLVGVAVGLELSNELFKGDNR